MAFCRSDHRDVGIFGFNDFKGGVRTAAWVGARRSHWITGDVSRIAGAVHRQPSALAV